MTIQIFFISFQQLPANQKKTNKQTKETFIHEGISCNFRYFSVSISGSFMQLGKHWNGYTELLLLEILTIDREKKTLTLIGFK